VLRDKVAIGEEGESRGACIADLAINIPIKRFSSADTVGADNRR
jgi:hypothetical protein